MVSAQVTGMLTGAAYGTSATFNPSKKDVTMDFGAMITNSIANQEHTKLVGSQDFSKVQTEVKKVETEVEPVKTETVQKEQVTAKEPVSEEKVSKIEEVVDKVTEELKKKLNLTDEELQSLLASLGMTVTDLMDVANLTKLVAATMDVQDSFMLITDGEFTAKVQELNAFIQNEFEALAQEFGVTVEELTAMVEDAMADGQEEVQMDVTEMETGVVEVENTDISADDAGSQKQSSMMSKDGSGNESHMSNDMATSDIVGNLTQSIEQSFAQINVDGTVVDTNNVIRQIVEAARVNVSNNMSSIEIALNPENLGKVNLTVVAKDGMVTAQLVAENESVKRALEAQLAVLKDNLNQQGIKIDAVEVTIASHSFESNAGLAKENQGSRENEGSKKRGLNLGSLEELNEEELSEDELRIRRLLDDNSSVEYRA